MELEEPKTPLWFWELPKQKYITLADWAATMRPGLAVYQNRWVREVLLSPSGIVGDRR